MLFRIAMALMVGAAVVAIDRPGEARREIGRLAPAATEALAEACRRDPASCLPD